MESIKRLTMNTSLKNARIFDDDAWEEKDGIEVRKEIKVEPETNKKCVLNNVKIESPESDVKYKIKIDPQDSDINKIKMEPYDNDFQHKIKIEPYDSNIQFKIKTEPHGTDVKNKIKIEPDDNDINNTFNDTLEEGELRDSFCSKPVNEIVCKTPPSPLHRKIKPDPDGEIDAIFDESPYNKELFNTLRIREETPIKTEDEESINGQRNTLKSARRTVFNRSSPYKRVDSDVVCEKRMSAKTRLGPKVDDVDRPRKRPRSKEDIEDNPEVIARREKQIEYGKNTIGYDNYINLVSRAERKLEDPQTPNKFQKYSRRGWDGLIRQWRLKLHKYDLSDK